MLDRSKQPAVHPIATLKFIEPLITNIGATKVLEFKGGDKEVIRLRVVFNAGSKYHLNPLVPVAVNALIKEGTKNYSAKELADKLDYYGAFLHSEIDKDRAWLELYCLSKHLKSVLPYFIDIVQYAEISQTEWDIYKATAVQQLRLNNETVSFLAKTKIQSILFENHPYGTQVTEDFYNNIGVADLNKFYQEHVVNQIVQVELVGQYNDEQKKYLLQAFGLSDQTLLETKESTIAAVKREAVFIPKSDAVQCAISLARQFPGRIHQDYFGVKVLVCALGGYFGSRLMANIREDKGFTYGIGAGVGSYFEHGIISISTEVGIDVKEAAVDEIYYELNRLIDKPISDEELTLVKNYMKGSLLKQCDGIFSQADLLNLLIPFQLDFKHIDEYMHVINTITPQELQALAIKYLQKEDFVEVVAGGVA
jgi:zinc protease